MFTICSSLITQVFEHETVSKSTTTRQLRDKVYGKKAVPFFPFADEAVAAYKAEGKISTHITHKATIHTLRDYVQSENLMFQDITPEFWLSMKDI